MRPANDKPVFWLKSRDVLAVEVKRRAVFLKSVVAPTTSRESETDIPVTRIDDTTYKLESRLAKRGYRDYTFFAPFLTVYT